MMDYEELIRRSDEAMVVGHEDEARRILTEGLERARADGSQGYVHLLEAELHALSGEYAEALEAGLTANEIIPGNALVMCSIGAYMQCLDRRQGAIDWFGKALLAKPHDIIAIAGKWMALGSARTNAETAHCHTALMDAASSDGVLILYRRHALIALKAMDEADRIHSILMQVAAYTAGSVTCIAIGRHSFWPWKRSAAMRMLGKETMAVRAENSKLLGSARDPRHHVVLTVGVMKVPHLGRADALVNRILRLLTRWCSR